MYLAMILKGDTNKIKGILLHCSNIPFPGTRSRRDLKVDPFLEYLNKVSIQTVLHLPENTSCDEQTADFTGICIYIYIYIYARIKYNKVGDGY